MGPYAMNYQADKQRRELVIEMMKKGDWRGVIKEFEGFPDSRDSLLLWIRPTLESLKFISSSMLSLGLGKISSIGCGCGTLEWLIEKATDLRVIGYEVNRSWWEGDHSVPHFIDIHYVDEMEGKKCVIPSDSAIMFCYFNNLEYFTSYLNSYQGPCVILIGPTSKANRHCDPEPLYLAESNEWRLENKMRLDGDDLVAIYIRRGAFI